MCKSSISDDQILEFRRDIQSLLRSKIREAIEITLEEELADALGCARYERSGGRSGYRNGTQRQTSGHIRRRRQDLGVVLMARRLLITDFTSRALRSGALADDHPGDNQLERRPSRDPPRSPRGFTLIEVLISAALLLVIAIGILPLFTRSIISNAEGYDHTQVANAARARSEEFFQLPFNSPELTLLAGTKRVYDEYFSEQTRVWVDGTVPAGEEALWTRTTTIRQYSVNDLSTPLANTAPAPTVHLKEILVTVQSTRSGPLGMGKQITVQLFKSQ